MPIAPTHFAQVEASVPGVSAEAAIEVVCNDIVALPEHDIVGMPLHLPVTWLGTVSDEIALDEDTFERLRKERTGWRKGPRILLVLPNPAHEDIEAGCALSPATFAGAFLREELTKAGIALADVLATHALRFALPANAKSYKSQHQGSNLGYVIEDIEHCRPEVIITFGAAAIRAVMDKKTKLESVRGSVSTYTFRDGATCKIVPTCSPMSFFGSHADIDQFRMELARAGLLLKGIAPPEAKAVDYRVLTTAESVEALCEELTLNPPKRIAFDTEFGNDVAREEYRYTLSIQLAWGKGRAAFVQFRDQEPQDDITEERPVCDKNGVPKIKKNGEPYLKKRTFNPGPKYVRKMSEADEKRCWAALQKLFLNPKIQLAGQHLRVDVEEFNRAGFNIDCRIPDGFDTMLVHYLLRGDDMHGLDWLVRTYAPEYGAYWRELEEWLDNNGRTSCLRFGYRNVPPPILIPYGLKDADATWVIAEELEKELERFPKLKALYWNYTSWTSLHLLDVERQGLLVDDERRMELRAAYEPVYLDLLDRLRTEINWPTFSPSSKQHVAYLLFNQHVYKDRDKGQLEAPADAKLLSLRPLYNTDKYPKSWDDVVLEGDAASSTPSTESDVFDILLGQNPDLKALTLLTHISVLSKFLSSYLAPIVMNEFGVPEDGKGFHNNIRSDHRVTTKLSQLTATGRYTSQKANLQTCLTGDHEVLTPNGWVRLAAYDGQKVAQWSTDGSIVFVETLGYTRAPNTEPCYYVTTEDGHVDVVSTPTHRWPVYCRARKIWEVKSSEYLFGRGKDPCRYQVPNAGYIKQDVDLIGDDNLLRLIVAVQADGSYQQSDHGIDLSVHKARKAKRLKTLLDACGIPYRDYSGKVGASGFRSSHACRSRFYVKGTRLNDICEKLMPDKQFGWWVLRLSSRELQVFCNELFLWDGLSTRKTEYFSKYLRNVEIAQAAFSLCGRRCKLRSVTRSHKGADCVLYIASVSHRPDSYLANSIYGKTEYVPNTVYCVTVPSGFFLTRRNGVVTVTGNSPKKQEAALFKALIYHKFGISQKDYEKRTYDGDKEKNKPAYAGDDRIEKDDRIVLHKFKTCIVAPEGYSLIEADFKTAELFVWAYVSGDQNLIEVVASGRDLHSEVAITSYDLPMKVELPAAIEAFKKGDKAAYKTIVGIVKSKYESFRTSAKATIFGVMYGRSANALARALTSAGTPTTREECQAIIDGIAKSYPVAWKWLKDNAEFAVENGYIENAFGARRYFPGVASMTEGQKAAVQREAKNSPIQGCIDFDQLVLTVSGMQRLRDLEIGSYVELPFHEKTLKGLVIDSGEKEVVRVHFTNGATLACTPDHRILAVTEAGESWVRADSLLEDSVVRFSPPAPSVGSPLRVDVKTTYRSRAKMADKSMAFELGDLEAWVVGFLIGDGCNSSKRNNDVTFVAAEADKDCLAPVDELCRKYNLFVQHSVSTKNSRCTPLHKRCISQLVFKLVLDALGVERGRHTDVGVPASIWNSPKHVQWSFVSGYLSADGTVAPDGRVTWVTASERFATDFSNLLAALGADAPWFKDGAGYYRGGMPQHSAALFHQAGGFRWHARKQQWLSGRMSKTADRYGTSLPNWLARQCLPAEIPPGDYRMSARVIYARVKNGAHKMSMAVCRRYAHLGFRLPENVAVVRRIEKLGVRPVRDISVVTDNEEEQRFIVNGFTVHNCVAYLLAQAGINFYKFKYMTQRGKELDFRILLPIHDAFLIEAKDEHVPAVLKLIDMCMSTKNKLPGTDYYLGVDVEVAKRWGEKAH